MIRPLHAAFATVLTCGACLAAPTSSDTLSVSGKVVSVIWIDRVKFESEGADGLMRSGSLTPRHYVILESDSGTAEQRSQLSGLLSVGLAKWPHWSVAKAKLTEHQVMIEIPGRRIPTLIEGATVEIKNYRVTGDEWLTGAEFDELMVSGQRIEKEAEQGGAGEPATRAESDSEGGDKPQQESEGRSRWRVPGLDVRHRKITGIILIARLAHTTCKRRLRTNTVRNPVTNPFFHE
ncbi:hypothetical protein GYB43_03765 [bacterium]|nr:hypothetical protein [bacterium]